METNSPKIDRGRAETRAAPPRSPRRKSYTSVAPPLPLDRSLRLAQRFTRELHSLLLDARADIRKGRRFKKRASSRTPHWSVTPVHKQSRFSLRRRHFEQSPNFPIDLGRVNAIPSQQVVAEDSRGCSSVSSWTTQIDGEEDEMAASSTHRNDGGVSPSSSPRLPSPPPFAEVQFGPKSPSVSGAPAEFSLDNAADDGASRRIRPGTKTVDMRKGPPFVPLHQVESAFQLQEYLASLYAKVTRNDGSNTLKPIDKEVAKQLATPPTAQDTGEAVDRNLWLYELCRLLCTKTSILIVGIFNDTPPCSSQTCPEMRASEWQYLCAVHEPPKSCCAIDYCNHTLDWASNILSSPKHFPSRLQLGEGTNAYQSMRQLTNIFRRVYRIYAHGWFQHREVFWAVEAEYGHYMLFKTVCDQYQLIPEDNYTIPPEAEGVREVPEDKQSTQASPERASSISILQKGVEKSESTDDAQANNIVTTGATTRRHKHTPSTGIPVTVIAEGQEEEEEETTMLDLGGPGPAQETSSSLSPPKPRLDRAKSPGLIAIPDNTDPERAPEDPTPIAIHESSPFGSPGPPEVTRGVPSENQTIAEVAASELNDDAKPSSQLESHEHVVHSIAADPEALGAVLDHLKETENSTAMDSDTETQIAAEDTQNGPTQVEDDEAMEKIDVSEVKEAKDDTAAENDEKKAETST